MTTASIRFSDNGDAAHQALIDAGFFGCCRLASIKQAGLYGCLLSAIDCGLAKFSHAVCIPGSPRVVAYFFIYF